MWAGIGMAAPAPDVGGGAAYSCNLYNCLLIGNSAAFGGAVSQGNSSYFTYNCTMVGNSTPSWGGGVYGGYHYNAIVYSNSPNNSSTAGDSVYFTNSCTTPAVPGWAAGNTTNSPAFVNWGSGSGTNFVAGDYHLRNVSPCINAGFNQAWMLTSRDYDGTNCRIVGAAVDMGPTSIPPAV